MKSKKEDKKDEEEEEKAEPLEKPEDYMDAPKLEYKTTAHDDAKRDEEYNKRAKKHAEKIVKNTKSLRDKRPIIRFNPLM